MKIKNADAPEMVIETHVFVKFKDQVVMTGNCVTTRRDYDTDVLLIQHGKEMKGYFPDQVKKAKEVAEKLYLEALAQQEPKSVGE
jgi:predicted small integral membrane protein